MSNYALSAESNNLVDATSVGGCQKILESMNGIDLLEELRSCFESTIHEPYITSFQEVQSELGCKDEDPLVASFWTTVMQKEWLAVHLFQSM